MRKSGRLRSLNTGEVRTRSKNDLPRRSADKSLSDSSRLKYATCFAGWSQPMEELSAAIAASLNSTNDLSPQEEALARALHRHAKAALRLTRLVEEAEKAATSAERSRIAHDIHDSLAHCFTGIYTQLEASAQLRRANPDAADSCVCKAKELAHGGLQEIRRLVTALQPDVSRYSDLAENLGKLAFESSCEASPKVICNFPCEARLLPPDIGYQLFQIAREAVGNALRYAQAKSVILRLAFSEAAVDLSIEDDGIGFRPDQPRAVTGYGLDAMRQRANRIQAKFNLRTSPGAGTCIQISARCPAGNWTG